MDDDPRETHTPTLPSERDAPEIDFTDPPGHTYKIWVCRNGHSSLDGPLGGVCREPGCGQAGGWRTVGGD